MSGRPYILSESTWKDLPDYDLAVLPWGATEAHNYHLPYGTDTVQCDHVAAEAARLAWAAGARVAVLPTVPFGVQTGQLDIPFCLNLNPSTQAAVLGDLARSLDRQGVRRLVVLNGHGGNDFRAIVRELQPELGLFLCTLDWYRCVDPRPFFDQPGDHAGELETSIMMHVAPDLVRPLTDAGPGAARTFRVQALREGWAWAPRQWTRITTDTGVGDPRAASAEKGAEFFRAVTERIASFFIELAAVEPQDMYEG